MKNNLFFLCSILFFSCGFVGNDNATLMENPMRADGSIDSSKLPIIAFDSEEYEFGKIVQGEKVSYSYTFKNVGQAPLIISNVTTSCGCTVPTFSNDPILPGASGKVDVVFDSENKMGIVSKSITITCNTLPNTKVLYIRGEISAKLDN